MNFNLLSASLFSYLKSSTAPEPSEFSEEIAPTPKSSEPSELSVPTPPEPSEELLISPITESKNLKSSSS